MSALSAVENFYIDDHAVLFALIAKNTEKICGDERLAAVIVPPIIRYCRERGLRAAARCLADGGELTFRNYMLYGEWADTRDWCRAGEPSFDPFYTSRVALCPWCEVWKKHGLLKYGKIYCEHTDRSLLHGFNPELRIEMGEILSHGGELCEYNWVGFRFSPEEEAELARERVSVIPHVTKDFLYHCGHVLSTFRRELYAELGLVDGRAIISGSLAEYAKIFGDNKTLAIKEESRLDFSPLDYDERNR
jgi:hypothetical protein